MIGELVLGPNFDFIMGEIGFRKIGTLFENHHPESVSRELFSKNATCRAGADNDEVHFIRSFVFGLIDSHFFSASFVAVSQPG